jgi:RHS repeat-associated protein
MLREYIWLDNRPVAMVDDTGASPVVYYVHTDQLGTPQKITDGSADVVWDSVFDPFGNMVASTGANWGTGVWQSFTWEPTSPQTMPLRFPGQYADSETALNQNWNRDYDPTIGRYVESDPAGLWGGVNTYAYVNGNPVAAIDRNGKYLFLITAAVGAVGGGVGNFLGQLVENGGNWDCVNWGGVGEAALFGGAAGAVAPWVAADYFGAAALGAASNELQYLALYGSDASLGGAATAAATGAVGGAIAGPIYNPFMFFTPSGFSASEAAAVANAGGSSFLRNILGGVAGSFNPSGGYSGCRCHH